MKQENVTHTTARAFTLIELLTEGKDGCIWNETDSSLRLDHEKGTLVIEIGE